MKLETDRLEIVAEDLKLARAAVEGREALAEQLKATVPAEWPPEVGADAVGYWIPQLEKQPDLLGWAAWHIIRKQDRVVIGGAGFFGLPNNGQVEVGYAILPSSQRHGYATETLKALVAWAFADARVDQILGETFPELVASIRVMERIGFALLGEANTSHDGEKNVVQYVLSREAWEKS